MIKNRQRRLECYRCHRHRFGIHVRMISALFAVLPYLLFAAPIKTVLTGWSEIADLCLAALSNDSRFDFLERNQIQLSGMELELSNTAILQLELIRKYSHAELFVLIRPPLGDEPPSLIVFDGRRGIRFAVVLLPSNPEAAADQVRQKLSELVELLQGDERCMISIASVRFVGLSSDQQKAIAPVVTRIEQHLLLDKHYYLLEREELSEVFKERQLTDFFFSVAPSGLQLRMEFSSQSQAGKIQLTYRLTDNYGTVLKEEKIDDIEHADCQAMALFKNPIHSTPSDPIREATGLLAEAEHLRSRNIEFVRQVQLLSSAAVLDPTEYCYQEKLLQAIIETFFHHDPDDSFNLRKSDEDVAAFEFRLLQREQRNIKRICELSGLIKKHFPKEEPEAALLSLFSRWPFERGGFDMSNENKAIREDLLQLYWQVAVPALRRKMLKTHIPGDANEQTAYEEYCNVYVPKSFDLWMADHDRYVTALYADMASFLRWQALFPQAKRLLTRDLESMYLPPAHINFGGNDRADELLRVQPEIVDILLADPVAAFQKMGLLLKLRQRYLADPNDPMLPKDCADFSRTAWDDRAGGAMYQFNGYPWCGNFIDEMNSLYQKQEKAHTPASVVPGQVSVIPPQSVPALSPAAPTVKSPLTLSEWEKTGDSLIAASCSDGKFLYVSTGSGDCLYKIDLTDGKTQLLQSGLRVANMVTDGVFVVMAEDNLVRNHFFATVTVYELNTGRMWHIDKLPQTRLESIAVRAKRIYLAGQMEIISCCPDGSDRKIEISNRRENPRNELEKLGVYHVSGLWAIPHSDLLLIEISRRTPLRFFLYDTVSGRLEEKFQGENIYIVSVSPDGEVIYYKFGTGIYQWFPNLDQSTMLVNCSERKIDGIPHLRFGGPVCYSPEVIWYNRAVAYRSASGEFTLCEFPWPNLDCSGTNYLTSADGSSIVRVTKNRNKLMIIGLSSTMQ